MNAAPSEIVTFLFTDIVGSTRHWQCDEQAMRAAMVRHDVMVGCCIERYGGRMVKHLGDGVFAVFGDVVSAARAACCLQEEFAVEEWPTASPLRTRAALHTGSAEARDGDFYGPAVHRSARLVALAHGGQVLASAAAAAELHGLLPEGMGLRDLGPHRLLDLSPAERVFQITGPRMQADFPPILGLEAYPNNLPVHVTTFVGREAQQAEVGRLLEESHLVTITGPGGGGKTRLALQVAAAYVPQFADGVWFVELDHVASPDLVDRTVAEAIGLAGNTGRPWLDVLVDHLAPRQALVVLDNCEHLVAPCAALASRLLRTCPGLRLLATSRELLAVTGEFVYPLAQLAVPDTDRELSVEGVGRVESVRLFVDRAAAVRPGFALDPSNVRSVALICSRLDGIPLAVELAAARVRVLTPRQIVERLDDALGLLAAADRTARPHSLTLRSAVDWSYGLLGPEEQILFARLSAFVGSFGLEAAESVCGSAPVARSCVLDGLTALVDKSLVVARAGEEVMRFRLLEVLREYASARLAEGPDADEVLQRHAAYFSALARDAGVRLKGPEAPTVLALLDADHGNFQAALTRSLDRRAAEPALQLAAGLWRYWRIRGLVAQARAWLERCMALPGTERPTPLLTEVVRGAAALAFDQGDYAGCRRLWEHSRDASREAGDLPGLADTLGNLGNVTLVLCDFDASARYYQESMALMEQLGDERGIAIGLCNLGLLAQRRGSLGEAHGLFADSLTAMRRIGHQPGVAHVLRTLGSLATAMENHDEARACLEESLALSQELGDRRGIAASLNNLADVARRTGDRAHAALRCTESLAIRRELGDRRGVAACLSILALIALDAGDTETATQHFSEALALQRELRDAQGMLESLEGLVRVMAETERPEAVAVLLGVADGIRQATGATARGVERARPEWEARARQALGRAVFEAHKAEGSRLPLDEVELRVLGERPTRAVPPI